MEGEWVWLLEDCVGLEGGGRLAARGGCVGWGPRGLMFSVAWCVFDWVVFTMGIFFSSHFFLVKEG